MQTRRSLAMLSHGLTAAILIAGVGCGDKDAESEVPTEFGERLRAMGFSTELGGPTDAAGSPLASSFQPLGERVSVFYKVSELLVAGMRYYDAVDAYRERRAALFDDAAATSPYDVLYVDTVDDSWATRPLTAVGCDVEGDGREEAAILVYNPDDNTVSLRVIDRTEGEEVVSTTALPFTGVVRLRDNNRDYYHYILDSACSDLDGDGRGELGFMLGANLMIVDDAAAEYASKLNVSFGDGDDYFAHIDGGDLDEDGLGDLIVSYGVDQNGTSASYRIYGLVDGALGEKRRANIATPQGLTLQFANLAVGDVDGDRLPEVVFAGDRTTSSDDYVVLVMDDDRTGYAFLEVSRARARDWSDHRSVALEVFKPEGLAEPRARILAHHEVLALTGAGENLQLTVEHTVDDYEKNKARAGDFTGDGRDDLALQFSGELRLVGYNAAGQWTTLKTLDLDRSYYTALCALNVDDDSAVLRYRDEHELLFTDPSVVATLASPPYHDGVDQDISFAETVFGKAGSQSTSQSHSFGVSVGFSFGFSAEAPLVGSAFSSTTKFTIETGFTYTASQIESRSWSKSFHCPAGEDQVIVSVIPFDVYYYDVLSSPNPDAVGTVVTINLPRQPQLLPMERETFNRYFEDVIAIDDSIYQHAFGDVRSYPTRAQRDAILAAVPAKPELAGVMVTPDDLLIAVGPAMGVQTLSMSTSIEHEKSYNFDLSISRECEMVAGGSLFGSSLEFSYGYDYSVSTSEETFIEATIANIYPEDFTADLAYSTGIFAYPVEKNDQRFIVVNYWQQ